MNMQDLQYGSDEHGLVWGYVLAPDLAARKIDSGEAEQWCSMPRDPESKEFLWLHFSLANTWCEEWLRAQFELPDTFYESFKESVGSTRLEQDDNSLVAVIHDVLFEHSLELSEASTVTLCIQPHVVISARLRPLRSLDRLRAMVRGGQPFRSTVELLSQLLQVQADVLVEIIRTFGKQVDTIEDRILANRPSKQLSELGAIRRSLVRLQRLLAPEPAALFRLLNRPPRWIVAEDVAELGQSAEEFSLAINEASSLVERAKLLQEEMTAHGNERTNRILFVLTLVTVFALPFTIVSGLMGMNVGGIPFAESEGGFWIVVVLLTVATGTAAAITFRKFRG